MGGGNSFSALCCLPCHSQLLSARTSAGNPDRVDVVGRGRVTCEKVLACWHWLPLSGPSNIRNAHRQFPGTIIPSTPGPSRTIPRPLLLVGCSHSPFGITQACTFYLCPLTPASCHCGQDPFQMASGQQEKSRPAPLRRFHSSLQRNPPHSTLPLSSLNMLGP